MAKSIPTGPAHEPMTAEKGRKFGLTVGLAFVAIGLVLLWRQHPARAGVLLSLGGVLAIAGLAVPTMLGPVERGWMKLAHVISKITTPIFMGIVYFVVITPSGFLRRIKGSPVLHKQRSSNWHVRAAAANVPEQMERQF